MNATPDDAALARELADEVGQALLAVRARPGLTGRALRDAGDAAAQAVIAARLGRLRPDDEVLSEEAPDSPARLGARRVWIVDPLDGTREFGEPGRRDWAVHIALWQDGELAAGAVSLPAAGLGFATGPAPVLPPRGIRPPDGLLTGAGPVPGSDAAGEAVGGSGTTDLSASDLLPVSVGESVRLVVSRGRAPAFAADLATELGASLLPMGSAGAKAAAVWLGLADAYVHAGGQYEWDSAAPVAVARAAGLHASRLDASPLQYNRPDPWLPDLLICRPELAGPILAWTAHHIPEVTAR
ncbi:MAG TPA: inositol monophosphatase family protein [Kineosporiaceae bacterium]|nr:inositol monophosphatase family protein [Kineosporiaceae bacterium]